MKRIVLYFSFISLVAQPFINASQAAPMPQLDQAALEQELANMSEEDLKKWQEKVTSEIFDMVETWDPKDQEAFYKEYERLSNMSQEELEQEITKAFADLEQLEQGSTPPEAPAEEEQPIIEEEIKVEEKKSVEKLPTENTEKVVKLLSNLITRIERFLRKAQAIPELAGKIATWAPKDKIKEWPHDLTWNTLKKDIEKLDQQLMNLKTGLDPKTKQPRYFSALLKDESLFNNLTKLSNSLTAHEPKVEIPLDDLSPVSKESRAAIKEILGAFAESLYTLNVVEGIDKIIASFEPRAEELRKEEESTTKKAVEASKYPRRETPRQEAGTGRSRYDQQGGGFDYSAYYGTPSGGYYGGGYAGDYAGAEPYPAAPDYSALSAGGAPSAPGAGGGEGAASSEKEGKGEKEKEGGAPKEEKKDGKEKSDKKEADADDSDVKDQLKNIRSHLEKAVDAFESNEQLADFAKHVIAKDPVDKEVVKSLSDLNRSLKKANGDIKAFKLGLTKLNAAQKDKYTKQFKTTLEQRYDALEELSSQLQAAKKKESSVPAAKKTAYFGAKAKDAEGEAKSGANINNILSELEKYFSQTSDMSGKQPAMKVRRSKKDMQ